MSIFNPQAKEINCKIVYYGPALSGKTTSMMALKNSLSGVKAKTVKIPDTERTLFFDFLALSSKQKIKNYRVKFQIYTVPGQVLYQNVRRLLLNGVDGVVFVADSRLEYLEDTLHSFNELELNLSQLDYDPLTIPTVIQYNKRDAVTAAKIEDISSMINKRNLPQFETIAAKGVGVTQAFEEIAKQVMLSLKDFS